MAIDSSRNALKNVILPRTLLSEVATFKQHVACQNSENISDSEAIRRLLRIALDAVSNGSEHAMRR